MIVVVEWVDEKKKIQDDHVSNVPIELVFDSHYLHPLSRESLLRPPLLLLPLTSPSPSSSSPPSLFSSVDPILASQQPISFLLHQRQLSILLRRFLGLGMEYSRYRYLLRHPYPDLLSSRFPFLRISWPLRVS